LRSLAALVALVLTASSLGQIAHFLLVPHAICAEHGELVELHGAAVAAADHHEASQPSDARRAQVSAPDAVESHDHCQLMARGQRELALPLASSWEPTPPAPSPRIAACDSSAVAALGQPAPLSAAPKTSPPVAALG
jgi:hypothetical protein